MTPSHHLEGWEKKLRALGEIYQDGEYEEIIAEIKAEFSDLQQKVAKVFEENYNLHQGWLEAGWERNKVPDSEKARDRLNAIAKVENEIMALFKNSSK